MHSRINSLPSSHHWPRLLVALLGLMAITAPASEKEEALTACQRLADSLRTEHIEMRAEAWTKALGPKVGKAVRVQLFKGNDYRFCVAVPPESGVHVSGAVLDAEGKPVGEIKPLLSGWGFILYLKPAKTGTFMVTMHQLTTGKQGEEVPCVMMQGYR
jgi:hypothetical protein